MARRSDQPQSSGAPDESTIALSANIASYDRRDDRRYASGAPHLKHRSILTMHESLIDRALQSLTRRPGDVRVLEVGAGNGLASVPWFRRRVSLTAVDSSHVMLQQLIGRAANFGVSPEAITQDAIAFTKATTRRFDVVSEVSMLHHIPNYLALLQASVELLDTGGCLITFQDPLRYDRLPSGHFAINRIGYFMWRLGQGDYRRGLKTRWRRLRGRYTPSEAADFEEYHVVRSGVDSDAIIDMLRPWFETVERVTYWSTQSSLLQRVGEKLSLQSSFGVIAIGRRQPGRFS